jgi:Rieske Fe-S protein
MADEDQERFEDYLELEHYIEGLQADKATHPPTNLTLEQARIYRMAALFRSASTENTEPQPDFVAHLREQLLNVEVDQPSMQASAASQTQADTVSVPAKSFPSDEPVTVHKKGKPQPVHFFSRRGILRGGAIAAASLVVGMGTEHTIEQKAAPTPNNKQEGIIPPSPYASPNALEINPAIPTTWHFVTTLADLGQKAVSFTTATLIGYVLRDTSMSKTQSGAENVIALSAACTHMGCIVQWEDTDRRFYCPCHGAIFAAYGAHIKTNYSYDLPPLPRLHVKIEDGKVYVEVPQAR